MSHPMYNPINPGKRMRPQGQYVHSGGQIEMNPQRPPPHPGAGSNFGSSGSTAINCGPSGGPIPSLLSLPITYRPERSMVPIEKDIGQRLDLNISRAREEAMQNSASRNTQFINVQRDTFPSTNTGMQLYLPPPAAQVNRPFTVDRGSTSLNWASAEESSKMYSSASPSFLGSGEGGKQTFAGLGNYDTSMSDKSAPPQETIKSAYTSESAVDILQQFGLLKEDLHHLTSYHKYQITPDNLPFILRQIRLEKEKRAPTSVHSTSYGEAQPMRSMGEMDPRGPVLDPDQVTLTVVNQSKVIDYGHSSKSELSSFRQLNKDTDLRQLMSEVPSKNPEPAHQAASETQVSKPPLSLIRGVHPGRPGLVLIGSSVQSHDDDQRKSTGQASKAPDLEMKNETKGGPKKQLQMHQGRRQPKNFPATKPPPLLQHMRPAPPNRGPSKMDAMTRAGPPNHLPPLTLMEDCSAATPRLFPHTCSLCIKQCTNLKDWLSHQNTVLHRGNTTLLRERYPEWDGRTPEFFSASALHSHPEHTTPGHNLQNRQQTSFQENVLRSLSPHRRRRSEDRKEKQGKRFSPARPQSPLHHHGSESRRERRSGRSRSPHTSKHTHRPRSDSYDRQTSSHYRSRSRSYDRLSSPRRREAERLSPRRSYERRSSPRRSDERRSSPRRSYERQSSGERSVSQHRRSRSADRLAKRILGKKAVQSLSKQSDLEAMVKTLAPVLLAELVNLKSSAASSSSKTEKTSSHKSSKATSSGTSSSTKPAPGRSTTPCMVTFSGVFSSLSHTDMVESMEKYGKVKSLLMYRLTKKARVIFEKAEDAKKLQCLTRCIVNGLPIFVDKPLGITLKKSLQKTAPQKKSGVSSSGTTKSHVTVKVKKPASSKTKNTTVGKFVSKAKVLVSKAKGISIKQVSKTVSKSSTNAKSTGKMVGGKNEASVVPKSKLARKRPPAHKAKKLVMNSKPVRDGVKSAPIKASKVRKQPNKTIAGKTSKPKTTVTAEEKSAKAEEKSVKSEAKSVKTLSEKLKSTVTSSSVEYWKTKTEAGQKRNWSLRKADAWRVFQTPAKASAESSTITSVSDPGKNVAELRHVDDNSFKTLTTAINKNRPATSESKNKESTTVSMTTPEDAKQKNPPHAKVNDKTINSLGEFGELDFYSGDFVTVDEINEDVEDMVVEVHPSSSKPTSRETKDEQSSASRKTSTKSASSSSKSSKGNSSSRSTSSSANNQKSVHEFKKSQTKTTSAKGTKSSSSLSKSVKTPPSFGQKFQSNQSKRPVRSSKPSSSGGSVCSPVAATKSSVKTQSVHKKDVKPAQGAVAKSDHQVSAESCSAIKDESINEMKKTQAKGKKNGKSTEEKTDDENKQVLDSISEKSDEQKNKENQDRRTEIQIPGSEQDHVIQQGADNDNGRSDECQEMEVDESTKLQDGALKDQAAAADDGEEVPTMTQVSENDETKEAQTSDGSSVRDTSDKNQVTSEETNRTPNSSGVKQKDDILLSERVCETSKEVGQTSNEEDHNGSKDTLKDLKLVVSTDLLSKADDEPADEESYEVIDSLDDPPTIIQTESEQAARDSKIVSRDLKPTRQGQSKSKTSEGENEQSPKEQDKTKPPVRTKDSKTEKEEESLKDLEEMVYEVVDSVEDDSVKKPSTTGSCSRRRTPRGNKHDEKTSTPVEEPKKSDRKEEDVFTVLDSVEKESPSDKPVVTRSTRGRRQNAAKKVEQNTKTKQDKIPTRRRHTPVRDSKEKDGEKTPNKDVPLKESAPTKTSDTGEADATHQELDNVEYDQPTTQKPTRGRPKRDSKTSKKTVEEKEEPVYQIVDSLEQDQEKNMAVGSSLQKERETNDDTVSSQIKDPQQATGGEDDETGAAKEDQPAEKQRSTSKIDFKKEEKRKESPKTNNATSTDVLLSLSAEKEDGASGKTASDETKNHEEDMEKMEVATDESVILPERGEKDVSDAATYNRKITEEETQEVVAPNEAEEDRLEKQGTQEQSVGRLQAQNLSTSDEAGKIDEKEDKEENVQTSNSSKRKHDDNTVVDKREKEFVEPEAKRSCSQSPNVPVDFQLPPFNPSNPMGEEFVVPKSGFFCNLCSIFYFNETTAKKIHCSSQKHYDNLQKHYQKLKLKTS
ncbi:zinc finger protein 638-like [Xiphophorus hellerii]|uniref:zinc finger protein 638-like n=1 Tax=Xiphophorus hellerii TaxID=8084 RepID=UPI0013B368F7|nr:zinc finger protein 638-like [Xiphophorus hellerii]XP_032438676.1 zinc finger protein 638-like [Xiphophorus hellerii]